MQGGLNQIVSRGCLARFVSQADRKSSSSTGSERATRAPAGFDLDFGPDSVGCEIEIDNEVGKEVRLRDSPWIVESF